MNQSENRTASFEEELAERKEKVAQALKVFLRFCGFLKIQPKEGGGRIALVLSPVQRAYDAARTTRDIVLKGRQMHMTTAEAARDLWWFLTKQGARVVVVCQSQDDDAPLKDISYKFTLFIDSLRKLGVVLEFGTETKTEWTLPARDATLRIIAAGASEKAAAKKGRGGTINRLHVSEAATFDQAEETMNALTESVPMDGSEVVIESTPKGASGWYYEQWRAAVEGRSGYTPHFFHWWKHPGYRLPLAEGEVFKPVTLLEQRLFAQGVPAECLNWYRWKVRDKGGNEDLVNQEFPSDPDTCFLVEGRPFFDAKRTAELLRSAPEPVAEQWVREAGAYGQVIKGKEIPSIRVWHAPERGRLYVIGVDVSEGTGGDAGAGIVLERGSGRHMATIWGQFRPWELGRITAGVGRSYFNALAAVERNNHGHACLRALETEHKYGKWVFYDDDSEHGWRNTETTRGPALDIFEQAYRKKHFKTNDRFLLGEMRTFTVNDRGRAEAAKGAHDDLVMAAAIAWNVICRPIPRSQLDTLSLPVA